jgi:Phage tail assembly chaperone protein, TAC
VLPWRDMLYVAHREYHILPAQFWCLSVREWRWLQHANAPHMGRVALQSLMMQFPDLSPAEEPKP